MTSVPLLTILTLTPLIGAGVVAGLGRENKTLAWGLGIGFSFLSLALAAVVWLRFNPNSGEMQFVERHDWIPSIGAEYYVAIDGLGLLMVLLSALIIPFALLASRNIQENPKAYVSLFLFLQAGLFGAFTALSFFHWFIFW